MDISIPGNPGQYIFFNPKVFLLLNSRPFPLNGPAITFFVASHVLTKKNYLLCYFNMAFPVFFQLPTAI